jgi:ATP-dependent Clp protease ATP-binding subunit ClpA
MIGYNFTERVRKVLAMAREEAARLHHEYVGTEHILLGILREGEGVASAVLQSLGANLDGLRQRIEEIVQKGKAAQVIGDLPYTTRAKKALEQAMSAARELKHNYVGTEHLLLGLLTDGTSPAAQVLREAGITLAPAREATLRILGATDAEAASTQGSKLGVKSGSSRTTEDEAREKPVRALHLATWRKRQAEAQLLEERAAWMRLRQALAVCHALGREPALQAHTDGTLRVTLGDGVVIAIPLPGLVTGEPRPPGL